MEVSPIRGSPRRWQPPQGWGTPGKVQAATPAPFATWTSSLRTPTGSSSRWPAAGIQPPFPGNPSRSFTERVPVRRLPSFTRERTPESGLLPFTPVSPSVQCADPVQADRVTCGATMLFFFASTEADTHETPTSQVKRHLSCMCLSEGPLADSRSIGRFQEGRKFMSQRFYVGPGGDLCLGTRGHLEALFGRGWWGTHTQRL